MAANVLANLIKEMEERYRLLHDKGVRNIQMLNEVLEHTAKPWWTIYGGREAIAS